MTRAAVALGSNLGDRQAHLAYAVESLAALGELAAVSNLYETAPVGGPEQGPFLNAVVIVETELPAFEFLTALHEIEDGRGRVRAERWGPRTVDLDLLLFGLEVHTDAALTVPHPRLGERRFVIEPLLDAWPAARLPDGTPVAELAAGVADQGVVDLGSWYPAPARPAGFSERGGWWVLAQFALIGVVVAVMGFEGPLLPGGLGVRIAGMLLALAGLVLAVLGLTQLGDRLTPFPEPLHGGGIVHGGVFAIVRHPIYGGIVLGLVGVALFRESVFGLLAAVTVGVFFWMKAGREEQRLERRFAHYADYRAETRARLIPWVL